MPPVRAVQKVLVFPAWKDNPYLNLMSLAPRASGRVFDGVTTRDELLISAARLRTGDVLHVHWTAPILQSESSDAAAQDALARFQRVIGRMKARGVKLVWTIHNRMPHELAHREAEIDLHRFLAGSADLIHIMSPHTPEMLRGVCDLPADRLLEIPHPSYVGVYGAPVPAAEARRRLGVAPERPTVLFLGQMRPYKGLDVLLRAVTNVAEREGHAPTLLLAGAADDAARRVIEQTLPSSLDVVAHYEFIHDSEIPTWLGAADLAVFPYRAILNSGSVHLASAFEVPAVLPGEAHLRSQFADEPWVQFFDTRDPADSLADIIANVAEREPLDSSAFDAFNVRLSPWAVSKQYRDALEQLSPTSKRSTHVA